MAGRNDIAAGKAHITLYVKNSLLVKGLRSAQDGLQNFGSRLAGIGAGMMALGASILTPLAAATNHFIQTGSALADMSARTGVAVGSLAELKFAAEQTGASLEDIEVAIKTQQRKGIKGTFDEIAAKIAAIEDPAKRTKVAIENWGKAGTKLLPLVNDLAALRQEARDLGLVPTAEAVSAADKLGDTFDKVKSAGMAAAFEIGAALAPVLLPALETVKNLAVSTNRWVRENGALFRTILAIGAGLVAAGAAVVALGGGIFVVGTVLGAAATAITTIAGIVTFLISPVGLVVVGLVAIGAAIIAGTIYWVRFTESGKKALQSVLDAFKPMADTVKRTLSGITNALKAGDLQLAATIAAKGIQLTFANMAVAITQSIKSVADSFMAWYKGLPAIVRGALIGGGGLAGALGTAALNKSESGLKGVAAGLEKELAELLKKAAAAVPPQPQPGDPNYVPGGAPEKLGARVLGFDPHALLALNNGAAAAVGPAAGRTGVEGAMIRALEMLGIKLEKKLGRLVEINERLLIRGVPPVFA